MANNSWQYGTPTDGYTTPIAENAIIDVPGVRLVGISQSSSTGVVWQPATDGGTCITVTALDVSIEGFLFTQGSQTGCDGISCIWDGTTAWGDNLTVRNCMFDDTVDTAISLDIYVLQPGNGVSFLDISENVFHDCATAAMSLVECTKSHIHGNSIFNTNAQVAAVATDQGITTSTGGLNQVYDNYFSCVLPVAANGDFDDLNTAAATDAWINNHTMNGDSVTNPT